MGSLQAAGMYEIRSEKAFLEVEEWQVQPL